MATNKPGNSDHHTLNAKPCHSAASHPSSERSPSANDVASALDKIAALNASEFAVPDAAAFAFHLSDAEALSLATITLDSADSANSHDGEKRMDANVAEAVSSLSADSLLAAATRLRDAGFDNVISYSKKAFFPLTQLCRDVCHYCTFAQTPKFIDAPFMSTDVVLAQAKAAAKLGCKEALFTLGEKPELRYSTAQQALDEMGFSSTLDYVADMAERL